MKAIINLLALVLVWVKNLFAPLFGLVGSDQTIAMQVKNLPKMTIPFIIIGAVMLFSQITGRLETFISLEYALILYALLLILTINSEGILSNSP